jgi:site-specific DNA-cytosine methylase
MLRSEEAFPYNHTRRHYSDRIIGIIEDMRPGETWDHASERKRREYAKIIKNEQFADESWEDAKERLLAYDRIKEAFYKDYYWSAYSRLAWDEPALTITANSNFLGSGRFTHPEENRGISIREAARLQSFDDDFKFITTEDDTADTERMGVGLDMIGEAVPPLLGKAIAKETAKHLKSQECIHASTN